MNKNISVALHVEKNKSLAKPFSFNNNGGGEGILCKEVSREKYKRNE